MMWPRRSYSVSSLQATGSWRLQTTSSSLRSSPRLLSKIESESLKKRPEKLARPCLHLSRCIAGHKFVTPGSGEEKWSTSSNGDTVVVVRNLKRNLKLADGVFDHRYSPK